MIQNDAIEAIRDKAYTTYMEEYGIGEIVGGLYMFVLGVFGHFYGWSIYPLIFLGFSYYLRSKLKQKFVYPRVGIAHFDENTKTLFKFKSKIPFIVPAYFVFIALFGLACLFLSKNHEAITYLYVNMGITGAFGLMVFGALIRRPKFYLYALMIMMIFINPASFIGDMPYMMTAMVAYSVAVYLLEKHLFLKKKKLEDKVKANAGHNIILVFASIIELYMILTLNHAEIINSVNRIFSLIWGSSDSVMLSGWALSLLVAVYFLRTYRFILYAVLIFCYQSLPFLVPSFQVSFWMFIIFLGGFTSVTGIYVLMNFVRKKPVLEAVYEG